MQKENAYIRWLEDLNSNDVPIVGGKNASLGEMIRMLGEMTPMLKDEGILVPNGFATDDVDVAVRSSATAEDLPEASFAGQQETFLNVSGVEELLEACRKCYASLFTDRAISYREEKGFDHMKVALSVGVQKMVRSDKSGAGVTFSIDTETGFPHVVVINASWGLGENVVQGTVTPDEYTVFKPLLNQGGIQPVIEKTMGTKEKKVGLRQGRKQTYQEHRPLKRGAAIIRPEG